MPLDTFSLLALNLSESFDSKLSFSDESHVRRNSCETIKSSNHPIFTGRQYTRKPTVYIDVLGLPTVTEAVQAASDMLRRGTLHAMACSIDDKPTLASKLDRIDRQKPQSSSNGRPASTTTQLVSGTPSRDPVSVYSAVTKRARKNVQESEPARQNLADSPLYDVKEKANPDSEKGAAKTWNSAKKAGPSILSKRNRAQISTVGGVSSTEKAFQPAPKREKRIEGLAGSTASAASKDDAALAVDLSVNESAEAGNSVAPTTSLKLQPFVKTKPAKSSSSEKVLDTKDPSLVRNPQREDLPHAPSDTDTTNSALSNQSNTPSLSSGFDTPKATIQSSSTSLLSKSALKPNSEVLQSTQKTQPTGILRSPGASKLPSAWSQITGKSSKGADEQLSSFQGNILQQKPGSATLFPKATFALGSSTHSAELRDNNTAQLLAMKKTRPQLAQPSEGAIPGSAEPVIPLPSSSGLQVKYVPGSEIVKGVRPNGYTVSRDGVVKPVVTFSPKPKLPHKLRQTSVEKLFEGYRDNKKLTEGDALARALRAEQEMYADARGRVDYRGAMTVRLKEIRK